MGARLLQSLRAAVCLLGALLLAWPAAGQLIDGARITVVNAPQARVKLGVVAGATNAVTIAAGANVTVTTNVTGSNVVYEIASTGGVGGGPSTNLLVFTNDLWLLIRGSNGVVVAAGTGLSVSSSGTAGQQTFTVNVSDPELLEWAGISTNKVMTTNDAWLGRVASNRVEVAAGAGASVVSANVGDKQVFTVSATAGASGGDAGDLQFNDGASGFAGNDDLTFDSSNRRLQLVGATTLPLLFLSYSNAANGITNQFRPDGLTVGSVFTRSYGIGIGPSVSGGSLHGGVTIETNTFRPNYSNHADNGTALLPFRTNFAQVVVARDAIRLGDTNGGSGTVFAQPGAFRPTNTYVFNITNPVSGQVFKFHSVTYSGGNATVVLTNDTDNTGGGSGGGWSGYDAPATNATVWSSDTNRTNVVLTQRTGQAVPVLTILGSNGAPLVEFDNRGFLVMTNGNTNYSLGNTRGAPPGTIAMGASQAGIPVPAWTDEFGRQQELGPAIWNAEQYYVAPGSGTAVFGHGGTTANTGGTTISHEAPDERKPYMVKVACAATSNSVGGISHNVNLWNSGAHNGSSRVGGGFYFSRWMITNNLAGIVGGGAPRFFIGLAGAASPNLTNIVNTTNATGQYLGLMGDITAGLEMFLTCRDGTAEFRTNTGINFVATNLYELSLDQPHTNRFVRWSLRDLTARLEAGGMFSNNVPTNFMKMTILCKNGTNRASEIYFSKMYLNPAQSPRWN